MGVFQGKQESLAQPCVCARICFLFVLPAVVSQQILQIMGALAFHTDGHDVVRDHRTFAGRVCAVRSFQETKINRKKSW